MLLLLSLIALVDNLLPAKKPAEVMIITPMPCSVEVWFQQMTESLDRHDDLVAQMAPA